MALLEIGPHLIKRLQDKTSAKKVAGEENLEGVLARAQVSRSVYVVPYNYSTDKDAGGGVRKWREVWLVIIVVQHAGQGETAQEMLTAASKLLAEVLSALDGWRCPPVAVGEIEATDPPPVLRRDGFGYFPLAFTVGTVSDGCMDSEV